VDLLYLTITGSWAPVILWEVESRGWLVLNLLLVCYVFATQAFYFDTAGMFLWLRPCVPPPSPPPPPPPPPPPLLLLLSLTSS
jgi:hypothetical protein